MRHTTRRARWAPVLIALAAVAACRSAPPRPYAGTVGELAAATVAAARAGLPAQRVTSGTAQARVVGGAEALALLAGWRDSEIILAARHTLSVDGALAVLLPGAAPGRGFLYVPAPHAQSLPRQALANDVGFVLDPAAGGGCTCHECEKTGNFGDLCSCQQVCRQVPCDCPPVDTLFDNCTRGCPITPGWSIDKLWTDPIPREYQVVRELFGEDARFTCRAPASGLEPGVGLLEGCPGK